MTQYSGRELLVKIGDGAGPEVFTALCGIDARSFRINNNLVDISTPDCVSPSGKVWQAMAYGVQSLAVEGSGIFANDAQNILLHTVMFAQTAKNFQIIVPGLGTYTGEFKVESLALSGAKEGNEEYEFALRSSGTIAFVAA